MVSPDETIPGVERRTGESWHRGMSVADTSRRANGRTQRPGGRAVSEFKVQALKELTEQQTRYAPPARRQEQLANAQQLRAEVEPGKTYPYQYVCFRVTDYRSAAHPDLLIPGADLQHDLALFIRLVERSFPRLE